MICKICGTENRDDASVCRRCGTILERDSVIIDDFDDEKTVLLKDIEDKSKELNDEETVILKDFEVKKEKPKEQPIEQPVEKVFIAEPIKEQSYTVQAVNGYRLEPSMRWSGIFMVILALVTKLFYRETVELYNTTDVVVTLYPVALIVIYTCCFIACIEAFKEIKNTNGPTKSMAENINFWLNWAMLVLVLFCYPILRLSIMCLKFVIEAYDISIIEDSIDIYTSLINVKTSLIIGFIYGAFLIILGTIKTVPSQNMRKKVFNDNDKTIQQGTNTVEQIKTLKEMRDEGLITEQEFQAKKKELLNL